MDMENVIQKVKRGAFVGAGAFSASLVDDHLFSEWDQTNTALGQIAVGAGVALASDEVGDRVGDDEMTDLVANLGEFGGYGIQGAGWSALADRVDTASHAGNSRTVTVNGSTSSTSSSGDRQVAVGAGDDTQETEEFELSTA